MTKIEITFVTNPHGVSGWRIKVDPNGYCFTNIGEIAIKYIAEQMEKQTVEKNYD